MILRQGFGQEFSRVKNIILDLDGVVYRLTAEFNNHCLRVLAETVVKLGVPLTVEKAFVMAKLSHKNRGSCFRLFHEIYDITYEEFNEIYPAAIDYALAGPAQTTAKQLLECPLPLAIYTNSSLYWTETTLKRIGLYDAVLKKDIPLITAKDVDYKLKTEALAYPMALEKLGWKAKETAIVEDSMENLFPAMDIEMFPVHIYGDCAHLRKRHPDVSYVFRRLSSFFVAVKNTRGRHNPAISCSLTL